MNLIPDSKLETVSELQDRLQAIYRQRNAEAERSLCNRRGVTNGADQSAQRAKLHKFDDRANAISRRLRLIGASLYA